MVRTGRYLGGEESLCAAISKDGYGADRETRIELVLQIRRPIPSAGLYRHAVPAAAP
ncbi:MAG: hypothetical protein QM784_07130 [Polyangiaceae bacterium]